ncbi:MAG TPA: lipid IV(A) 3-deoxy-D-manno-octulosonic acid transferase [Rhodocyclaceae bacterium]|nr:lipid IV(A) 3-deoxy-D-manno-octulosonic acid transferase [Rhodocyclaceae bacterium]
MPRPRLLYTLLLWLLLPWALLHLLWRSRLQPEYRRHWGERFGFYPARRDPSATQRPVLWIHAVSVGETRAAQPLVQALQERYPQHRILLTHMTPTGRETSVALFGDTVERVYLAYDYPGAVARFLAHWQPEFGLIMETELWPNLVAACAARGTPLMLANARLSQRSARRYDWFSGLTREALQGLTGIAAQTTADAKRLEQLGARQVRVVGNIKFDITPPDDKVTLGVAFRQRIGERPVFLCASTRDGEEKLLLEAWRQTDRGTALLLLVPRHPQRFDEVEALVRESGLRHQRRSDDAPFAPDTDVWLGDSLGEMFAYYAACDVAFIGGSLLDFGSQNLIEACALGKPVLLGPSTYNFAEAAANALVEKAALQCVDASTIVATARQLLADPARRDAMGIAALAFTGRHRGATARLLNWIADSLSVR